jgi:two-component system, LuxR family, sensor kinase FixL
MDQNLSRTGLSTSVLAAAMAGIFAIAVFLIDTVTPLEIAIAVLYAFLVLMAANYFQVRGVLLVSAGCLLLAVFSFLVQHGFAADDALGRLVVSMAAIGAATLLALRNQSANSVLRERARLLDLTHDTIFVRDMNDVITYWNRGAEELYGWSQDEAIGRVTHQLLQTEFPEPLQKITEGLLRKGRWEGQLIHTARNGTRLTVASRWALEHDERGRPVEILETNNDITERNRAEEALQRAQAELAHINRVMTLGELSASIAHEVNQPLTGVVTNGSVCLWLLEREPLDIAEIRGAVESMISDSMRASEVVKRVRSLTKKSDLHIVAFDINDIINDAIHLLQREIRDHAVSLQLELAPALPEVLGDRVQLQQVLINLVMNGVEAMAAINGRPRALAIRSRLHETNQVLVEVEDSGAGIEPANLDRLFGAFFTTKAHGMGMGLSICRSIVQAHGGQIWASPNPGSSGSSFRFAVPAAVEGVHEGGSSAAQLA